MTLDPKDFEYTSHHNHSSKSFSDSIYPTEKLVKDAKKMGYKSATLTDHGSLVSMPDLFNQAEKEGIKPIIGIESYFCADEVKDSQKQSRHLLILVKNEIGWKNLLQLTYKSSIPVKDGGTFYVKPRFTDKEIFKHSDGLIFSSACLNGVISDYIVKGDETSARLEALKWKENVEHFYIELMPHRFKDQTDVNYKLVEIARDLDIPLLATLDAHYDSPDKHEAWMINGAIRRRQTHLDFEDHMSPDMYFKNIQQIIDDFKYGGLTDKEIEEAIRNSVKIADMCDFKWENRQQSQPVFNADIHAPDHLKKIAWQGLCRRFGGANKVPQEYIMRLKEEWEVICKMGYADYFLILHDFISYARHKNIAVGPGRGSGCGSLMLWALHVTEIDSIKYKLPFSRFLNVERDTSPDYDADIEPAGRKVVIDYLKQKYGIEHVLQVANHSELKAKSAIKDVARFYNYSFDESNAITDKIPEKFKDEDDEMVTAKLEDIVEMDEIKPYVEADPKLFEIAKTLEGSFRGASRHAGGVIITNKPVTEIIPVMKAPGADDVFDLQTQWNKEQLEAVGIHKYDILGLSTLGTLKCLEKVTGVKCEEIPLDDPKTWEYLRKAKNMCGIFQFGASESMRSWCRKVIPEYKNGMTGLLDYLSDINAINRPAVLDAGMGDKYVENRNAGRYDLPYDYPAIRNILDPTNGIILYQEQVIFLAKEIAGFSLGKGDLLRRNLEKMGTPGKKSEKVIKENKKFREEFVSGAIKLHGYSEKIANGLFDWLSDASGYGFTKNHSLAYSLIGYRTAYFKANYPLEFYTISINEAVDKDETREELIREVQTSGIDIQLPNVDASSPICTINNGSIVYGLNMIKGMSEKVAEIICAIKPQSFSEFCEYFLSQKKLNKKHMQILIKLGYFEKFGNPQQLWMEYQKAVWYEENRKKKEDWQERKNAGRRVREFTELKFEYEELEGNKKQWLIDLIGFQWETRLMEVMKELEPEKLDEDKYIVGEVKFVKSGISKFKRPWCLITLQTKDGEKKGFLQDATLRIRKGEVLVCRYTLKGDTYTFINPERY